MAWRRERPVEGGARGAGPAVPLLVVQGLDVHYGRAHALQDVSLTLERGVLGIVGRNGMGKTTLCNAITGLVPARGSVRLAGQELVGLAPHRITRLGIAYVPQGRRVWPSLTVDETLRLVARHRREVDRVYAMFPRLAERKGNGGSQLSGGEQQMLAIGRALLLEPRLLVMDEPTEGLAPVIVEQVAKALRDLDAQLSSAPGDPRAASPRTDVQRRRGERRLLALTMALESHGLGRTAGAMLAYRDRLVERLGR